MTHPSKRKGNRFERKMVLLARECGLNAKGVPLSGACEDYPSDIIVEGFEYQCKIRNRLPNYLQIHGNEIGLFCQQDRGEPLAIVDARKYLELLAYYLHGKEV